MFDVSFDLLGSVEVTGMRAEVRQFSRLPTYERTWEAPAHILSYRMTPGSTLWTRRAGKHAPDYTPMGPLAFRPRSAVWECKSNGQPVLTVMSVFSDNSLPVTPPDDAEPLAIDDFAMMELMRLLHDEIRAPGFASTALVESVGEILRVKLTRLASPPGQARGCLSLQRGMITRIRDYVAAQRGRSPSVAELAKLCQISRRSLLRRFKSETGMTVAAYLAQLQLERAKALLANSKMALKQIAHEAGFSTQSQFSVAFKRSTGMTPSAFRIVVQGT